MKIAAVVCLMAMAFTLGDAIKCYNCFWSKDEPSSLSNDIRCADHFYLPEEFLIDCPESEFGNGSCSLMEVQDEYMNSTMVKRACSPFNADEGGCYGLAGDSGVCTCSINACNEGKLLD